MRFVIVSHTKHFRDGDRLLAYGPYVREMNLWTQGIKEVVVVAPQANSKPGNIHEAYEHKNVKHIRIPAISLTGFSEVLLALIKTPYAYLRIFFALWHADHIHLRCPGNIGLLGCIAQVFYPSKTKTAKYAGNWDPGSKQPLSYRLQQWILSNRFLSRNMKVLVYGEWPGQSKNVVSFFTASYSKDKIEGATERIFNPPYRFLFVGSLAPGKRPLYAVQLIEQLIVRGIRCRLDLYGEGAERMALDEYIEKNQLGEFVQLHGNVPAATVELAYRDSHLLILPSRSEGWPKVVAEAMFWGTVPAVTPVSCVPWMTANESRGILLKMDLEQDVHNLKQLLEEGGKLTRISLEGQRWSHKYTIDSFKEAIQRFL